MFVFKQIKRMVKVAFVYRSAGFVLLLRYFGKLPGFRFQYDILDYDQGTHGTTGHAAGMRRGGLTLFGRSLFGVSLDRAAETSAFHFYLNRPVRDFMRALEKIENNLGVRCVYDRGQTVLEAGCGAGRYLQAFTDYYGGNAIGIDSYAPAISVANAAKVNEKDEFLVHDLTDLTFLDSVLARGIDTVIVSSFLVHYPSEGDMRAQLIRRMAEGVKLVVGVEKCCEGLNTELEAQGFGTFIAGDNLYFALDNRGV